MMSLFYNHSNFSKIEEQNISAIFLIIYLFIYAKLVHIFNQAQKRKYNRKLIEKTEYLAFCPYLVKK